MPLLPPDRWAAYASQLQDWLRPGGRLFVLFMQTGRPSGPPFDCPLDKMRTLFPDLRWDWPPALPDRVPHPSGLSEQPAILTRR